MKLLFIIPSITNYFTFLEDLIEALNKRGHEVHLATSRKHIARISAYRRNIECVVHDIDFPRAINPFRHMAAARQVQKLVNEIKPDIINIHFSAALFTSTLRKSGQWPPSTATIHGLGSPLISGWRKLIISQAEKWSSQRVDEVFVLTEDDKEYLQSMSKNVSVSVLESFGMGCDLNRFNRNNIDALRIKELQEELNLKSTDFVYIFIGRQTNFKGFDKVVMSFLKTLETHPDSKLLLVGEKDRIHPTSLQPKYEKEIVNNPAIIKVGWQENVQDYLALSHLNVFPSEREGLPVNLMESLAVGVPVLTVNSRGCKEVVRNKVDGIVLDKYEIDDIAKAMRGLQDDKKTLATYAENALEGRHRFDREAFIKNQFEIFERLVGESV